MGDVVTHPKKEQRMTAERKRPSPALLSNKEIAQILGVLVALSLLSWLFFPDLTLFFVVGTVFFALWIGILTPLAYRNARKHGEWPPKDEQR